jgi:hypothetical protein
LLCIRSSILIRSGDFQGFEEWFEELFRLRGGIEVVFRAKWRRHGNEEDAEMDRPKPRGDFQTPHPLGDVLRRRSETAAIARKVIR